MSANPDDIAAVDGDATPADPVTIDVPDIKARYEDAKKSAENDPWNFSCDEDLRTIVMEDHPLLITAAEALRERVAKVEVKFDEAVEAACQYLQRAEAAEALVVELAEALERARAVEVKGYAAGLEAAAKWHERKAAKGYGALHRDEAKAIRALGKEEAVRKPAGKQD